MDAFGLIIVFIILCIIKKMQSARAPAAPAPAPTVVPPSPAPVLPVTLTLEVPSRFNPCETITIRGTLTWEQKPVPDAPITIYASAFGRTEPIVTVTTDRNGEYIVTGNIGLDFHSTIHAETQVTVWAETTIENTKYSSPRFTSTVYIEPCMGPCPGTMLTTLGKLSTQSGCVPCEYWQRVLRYRKM